MIPKEPEIKFNAPDAAQQKASADFKKSTRGKIGAVIAKAQHPLVHATDAVDRAIRGNPAVKLVERATQKRAVKAALAKSKAAGGVGASRAQPALQGGPSERDL